MFEFPKNPESNKESSFMIYEKLSFRTFINIFFCAFIVIWLFCCFRWINIYFEGTKVVRFDLLGQGGLSWQMGRELLMSPIVNKKKTSKTFYLAVRDRLFAIWLWPWHWPWPQKSFIAGTSTPYPSKKLKTGNKNSLRL